MFSNMSKLSWFFSSSAVSPVLHSHESFVFIGIHLAKRPSLIISGSVLAVMFLLLFVLHLLSFTTCFHLRAPGA